MERQLLTVEETADVLNIGRTRVYELLATGELASIRIGRLRRIPIDSIHDYIVTQLEAAD